MLLRLGAPRFSDFADFTAFAGEGVFEFADGGLGLGQRGFGILSSSVSSWICWVEEGFFLVVGGDEFGFSFCELFGNTSLEFTQ